MTMDELIAHAESLGMKVKWADLNRRAGEVRRSGLTLINHRKSETTQRIALAHEIGHWVHGHGYSAMHDVPRDELQADTHAAHLLISPVDYALAERMHEGHLGAIARELDVDTRIVQVWRDHVLRRAAASAGMAAVRSARHLRAVG
ncbi:ImmA/IrrE family metallo-endopeptidase [Puerhibacterium puerhi]|uniref:ImmA/IrrE family metallo-endopeptidase n=1 Tax=Puerhibacterium puerhi TaxID=2692623 RepID=UPI00135C3A62|nr:ImmA/IrrE family metallo-endopeptidase [Puerhibacterium puerhi]